jgi:hypothetical protein
MSRMPSSASLELAALEAATTDPDVLTAAALVRERAAIVAEALHDRALLVEGP